MPASPNVLNYHIGKATVSWTPDGGSARDLGNCSAGEITPEITFLDHFASTSGIRTKDRSVATETTATIRLVMDEITPENLSMLLFGGLGGTVDTNSDGDKEFSILDSAVPEVKGALTITGTNSVGNKFTAVLPTVSFQPSGSFDFISEEWNEIELTGELLNTTGTFGTITETEVAS